jgi:Uma2 family endonuclease
MVITVNNSLTLKEFLQLPETKPPREFIDGQIIQKPMPQGKHSTIQGDLVPAINTILKPPKIARAYPELRCTFGNRSLVPDVSVFLWKNIPRDEQGKVLNTFAIAPDWMIEILSPDQNQTKVVKNILYCLSNGTQMGWLIDPEEEIIFVYFSDKTIAIFESKNDLLPVPAFASNFQITVGQLFDWLRD